MKKQIFRVKQLADQTFFRADKSEVLNSEELQVADSKIEYLRGALSAIVKKNNDVDKRAKKVLNEQSARKNEQDDTQGHSTDLFSIILREVEKTLRELSLSYFELEKQLDQLVYMPIQSLLDTEFHCILKLKRNLSKYILDKDSASNRYQATKKETLKEDMEEADHKVEQNRDALAHEMFNLLAQENDIAGYLLQILKCQKAYHDDALKYLENIIPQLEKQIGDSAVKRVYGIALSEHLRVTDKKIALPLEICISQLLRIGLNEEGLFRITGGAARVKRLKASIDSGCFSSKLIPEYNDAHVLASALKSYLRELPEPLLTSTLYNDWVQSTQVPENERLEVTKNLIARLPEENRNNLALLIQFLAEITRHSQNKMTSTNIAIVVGPNLLWDTKESMNVGKCAVANMLVELFIKEVQTLFPQDARKMVTFQWNDDDGFIKNDIEFHTSAENVSVTESPKPNSKKKKTPAPVPPNNVSSKTDHEIAQQNEKNLMSASYPSSSTLTRTSKSKEIPKTKSSVGVATDDRKTANSQDDAHKNDVTKPASLVSFDSSKTVAHKFITEPAAPVQVSKAKPVQPVIAQNACDNKNFKSTIVHHPPVNNVENVSMPPPPPPPAVAKPVAAPRSIDAMGVTKSSSVRIELKQDALGAQSRKPEIISAKPQIPVRPASLQKRPSVELDPSALHRTQCSVYNLANKQQPSYVNVQNLNEKFQPGHDNQITEKEKFLGHHQPTKYGDINSNNRTGLPPKGVRVENPEASKSNENIDGIGEKLNGNTQKTSHVRTRSDGNVTELSGEFFTHTPPSPRKPTQPPPPPPDVPRKEPDSTDL